MIAPFDIRFRLPLIVEGPNTVAKLFVRSTLLAETTDTGPVKLFDAFVSEMLLAAPAVRLVAPATEIAPVCDIKPLEIRLRLLLMVEVPIVSALASVKETLLPETIETAPMKSFAGLVRVISLAAPAVRLDVPFIVRAPV